MTDEDDPLSLTSLSRLLHLAFEGVIQGVSCSCSSLDHSSTFAGVDNSNVQGHIFPCFPVWKEDISRAGIVPRDEEPLLLPRP